MRRLMFGAMIVLGATLHGVGQMPIFVGNSPTATGAEAPARNPMIFSPSPSQSPFSPEKSALFPQYVQENPHGYSYLCRLELEIEDKLPVGMWMKIGEEYEIEGMPRSNAYVRFKVLRF